MRCAGCGPVSTVQVIAGPYPPAPAARKYRFELRPPISFSLVRKKRIKGRYSPPFSFSRKKKRSALDGVRRKRGFGAGPWDPCFYRSAAAYNNFSAGLVQDRHRAVFPTAAASAGRGSRCAAVFYSTEEASAERGGIASALYQIGNCSVRCCVRKRQRGQV